LKTLPNSRLEKVTLVDISGMIDSADASASCGYDFQSVVRWFAERADLIMLFFDPETQKQEDQYS
jgi:ribosome-interacting GTPase 1